MLGSKKSELLGLFEVPELFNTRPWLVSLVLGLSNVSRVEIEAFLAVKAMVESGLLVVLQAEKIQVVVFEIVLSGTCETNLSLVRVTKGLLEQSWWDHDLAHSLVLSSCHDETSVETSPGVVVVERLVTSSINPLSIDLCLLWRPDFILVGSHALELLGDIDQVKVIFP